MTQMRYVIPPLGVVSRGRADFLRSAFPLPREIIEDERGIPRWVGGLSFQQLGCDPLQRVSNALCEPRDAFTSRELGEVISFDSFTIIDAQMGSTICTELERLDGDIQIRYPAMVSQQLAAELMEGGNREYDGDVDPNVNPSLTSAATVLAGGPFNPNDAFALLEQAAADFLHGAQATLHLTPRGFSVLNMMDQGVGDPDGRWTTSQGHLVIADSGYTGPEPTANFEGEDAPNVIAHEWWYMTGPVAWAMGAPMPVGEPWQRFNPSTNQIESMWEAPAIVVFDPCAVVAVPVCYDPFCGGAPSTIYLTQEEFDALDTPDPNIIYIIIEDGGS